MPEAKLAAALTAVNWNGSVSAFLKNASAMDRIARANLCLAIWSKQFEDADQGNPALCFVRDFQIAGHHVAALAALALYRPAAAAMRGILEAALYYTYFRKHLAELATLSRDSEYYVSKTELLEYHTRHTPEFIKLQNLLDLKHRLNRWYSAVSAIIHGQIPGAWVDHRSLAEIGYSEGTLQIVVNTFTECEETVHRLFLCTIGRELWDSFTSTAKRELIRGLSGRVKTAFRLDSA